MTHSRTLSRLALLALVSIGLALFNGIASAQPGPSPPTPLDVQVTPTKVAPETPEAGPTPEEAPGGVRRLVETDLIWILVGVVASAGLILAVGLTVYFVRRSQKASQPAASPPPTPSAQWPCLEVPDAPGGPCHFRLKPGSNTIGRDEGNDVVITQKLAGWKTVSAQHARIHRADGRWVLEDLNSLNGVYVNGQRTGRNLLHEGWQFSIGGVRFVFHLTSEPSSQENEHATS